VKNRAVAVPARVNFITLACRDVERMAEPRLARSADVAWKVGSEVDERGALTWS
jgi:hypothetical protein